MLLQRKCHDCAKVELRGVGNLRRRPGAPPFVVRRNVPCVPLTQATCRETGTDASKRFGGVGVLQVQGSGRRHCSKEEQKDIAHEIGSHRVPGRAPQVRRFLQYDASGLPLRSQLAVVISR